MSGFEEKPVLPCADESSWDKDNGILAVVESGLEEGESILDRHPEEPGD